MVPFPAASKAWTVYPPLKALRAHNGFYRTVSPRARLSQRRRQAMTNQATVENMTVEQWLAIRREAALQIDPEQLRSCGKMQTWRTLTASIPTREECIGRVYFAVPGRDVWVCFYDLPEATGKARREKQDFRRAYPEPTVYRRAEELLIVGEDRAIRACTHRASFQADREHEHCPQGTGADASSSVTSTRTTEKTAAQ